MSNIEFVMLYDGQCPICQREINWLRSKNSQGKLGLIDITDEGFDAESYGTSFEALMAEIHGIYADGRLVKGVEVFCASYQAVGLGWLVAPMQWRLLRPVFDWFYRGFAKHRLRLGRLLGGRACDNGHCGIE
jgi:predicted DCC family thiol-disulfide oxidoreductase YuxK